MIKEYLSSIIQMYPFYGTNGLFMAQKWVESFLKSNNWDEIFFDEYHASDISHLESYVDVTVFGPPYQHYENVNKYNVIAIKNGCADGPTLILNGHIDVDIVDENKSWFIDEGWKSGKIIDGKLYGRGAADMIGGLLGLMTGASKFIKDHPSFVGRIIFSSVCDEEIGGNGTLRFLDTLKRQKYDEVNTFAIIAEPTENKPCLESLGFMHINLEFNRNPVHMGIAAKENNALNDATHLLTNFSKLLEKATFKDQRDLYRYNFGIIKGGIDPAIPIGNLTLGGTIFYPESISASDLFESLQKILETEYQVKASRSTFGFPGASFSPNKLTDSIKSDIILFPSPCDARLFKEYNIPTIIWGPGSLAQAHSIDEFICIKQLEEYELLVYETLCRFFSV